jgi:uncharacterized SAM-dependent methyltransferase
VQICGERFDFAAGETIHTENSYKYSVADFQAVARRAGFLPEEVWTDPADLFSVHLLRVAAGPAFAASGSSPSRP